MQKWPKRLNAVKVLVRLDVGGSMDCHIQLREKLLSAAKAEFKPMKYLCFPDCLCERL